MHQHAILRPVVVLTHAELQLLHVVSDFTTCQYYKASTGEQALLPGRSTLWIYSQTVVSIYVLQIVIQL